MSLFRGQVFISTIGEKRDGVNGVEPVFLGHVMGRCAWCALRGVGESSCEIMIDT
jgi:hypothetical protein